MKKKLMIVQTLVLVGGTIFAWTSWIREYLAYCKPCGSGTNPFYSSCFYGAIGFTVVMILGFIILSLEYKEK